MITAASSLLLVLDTAQEDCAAVLCAEGEILASRCETVGNKHAERLLTLVDDVLAEAGRTKRELAAVVFGAGPGSFTGLRVACGVAQGVAWALRIPVLPISNLSALAEYAARERALPEGTRILAANDARMHECYAALLEADGAGSVREVEPARLVAPEALPAHARASGAKVIVGSAASVYAGEMQWADGDAERLDVKHAVSESLARLGARAFAAGEAIPPAQAAPLYVRDRVALTMAERARGERL